MTLDMFEEFVIKSTTKEIISYIMEIKLMGKESLECATNMNFIPYIRGLDNYAWYCLNSSCCNHKKYISLRQDIFLQGFNISLKDIMVIMIKYCCKQQLYNIKMSLDISESTIKELLTKLSQDFTKINLKMKNLAHQAL
ncbi:hypothetical protein H311_02225 [Anncaliia algerae PRA109]|nr:hypothetical protein H311_02225 [Anncaliia algerae PRA109]